MPPSCGFDTIVAGFRDDGAERLGIGSVPETPYVFYLFLGQIERLRDIDERGKGFDAWRI